MIRSGALFPSSRALENLDRGRTIDFNNEISGQPFYDPVTQPNGLVSVSGAENELMHDFTYESIRNFLKTYDVTGALDYGPVTGPPLLSEMMARYVNRYFKPSTEIKAMHILPTNGVSSVLDMIAFNCCDFGEGIMVITPTYSMYEIDLCAKAQAVIVEVSSQGIKDQFSASYTSQLIARFHESFKLASHKGIKVRGVLLCNPSNPQGRCYSRITLLEIAKFCRAKELHLFSDEIYAMSCFEAVEGDAKLDTFTSVLSLKADEGVVPENVHSMYGASKDFGMGGLRLGFLITRNELFWKTCRRTAVFTWLTPFSTSYFISLLKSQSATDEYLTTYQSRLQSRYIETSNLLRANRIAFDAANSGLFVWIDLRDWLEYFDGPDFQNEVVLKDVLTREEQLYRYLLRKGVMLNMGEESRSSTPGRFRFVYTGPEGWAGEAIRRIAQALERLQTSFEEGPSGKIVRFPSIGSTLNDSSISRASVTKEIPQMETTQQITRRTRLSRIFCFR